MIQNCRRQLEGLAVNVVRPSEYGQALCSLGKAYESMGNFEKAIAFLERALKIFNHGNNHTSSSMQLQRQHWRPLITAGKKKTKWMKLCCKLTKAKPHVADTCQIVSLKTLKRSYNNCHNVVNNLFVLFVCLSIKFYSKLYISIEDGVHVRHQHAHQIFKQKKKEHCGSAHQH